MFFLNQIDLSLFLVIIGAIMSFIDSIIVKILSHNPKLTRKEIQEML
ncbi:unnamed protein product, partial [marine sediment metagenome]